MRSGCPTDIEQQATCLSPEPRAVIGNDIASIPVSICSPSPSGSPASFPKVSLSPRLPKRQEIIDSGSLLMLLLHPLGRHRPAGARCRSAFLHQHISAAAGREEKAGGFSLCSRLGMLMGMTHLGEPQRCITQRRGLAARERPFHQPQKAQFGGKSSQKPPNATSGYFSWCRCEMVPV